MVGPWGQSEWPKNPNSTATGSGPGDLGVGLGYTQNPNGIIISLKKIPYELDFIIGNFRGMIKKSWLFHPERVVKLWVTPTFITLDAGGPSESWILSTRPCCWVTWHWCWCSYLSTTWRDARATKQWWKNAGKFSILDTIKGCPNDEILHHWSFINVHQQRYT